jgi:hypothetical protein
MATVNGITAEKAKIIEDNSVTDGEIIGTDLFLTTAGGTQFNAGTVVPTAELAAHAGDQTGVHGVGIVVGETETQTLSGKTLTTPTIASFVNANHSHDTSIGGGFVTLDWSSNTTSTQRLVTQADPGPKTLNTITLGIGTWLVLGSLRGVTTNGTSVRFRVHFTTSGGTLISQGVYDEWDGTGLARGATIFGVLANGTAGNVTITANLSHDGNTGTLTCGTDNFDIHAIMIAG